METVDLVFVQTVSNTGKQHGLEKFIAIFFLSCGGVGEVGLRFVKGPKHLLSVFRVIRRSRVVWDLNEFLLSGPVSPVRGRRGRCAPPATISSRIQRRQGWKRRNRIAFSDFL